MTKLLNKPSLNILRIKKSFLARRIPRLRVACLRSIRLLMSSHGILSRSRGGKDEHSRYDGDVVVSKCFRPLVFTKISFPPLIVHLQSPWASQSRWRVYCGNKCRGSFESGFLYIISFSGYRLSRRVEVFQQPFCFSSCGQINC